MTSTYTLSATVTLPYDQAVQAVRDALTEQGFGMLTEIDLAATLKEKLDVEVPAQVILGACRPLLAYEALRADTSIAAVLPCNVVVRAAGEHSSQVEAFDPDVMLTLGGGPALESVAADARQRLLAMLGSLPQES